MAKTQISYTEAMKQLEDIVQHMQDPSVILTTCATILRKGWNCCRYASNALKRPMPT